MGVGYDKLKTGDFNALSMRINPGGVAHIRLIKRGDDKVYHVAIKNYCEPTEQLEEDEVINP